MLYEYVCPKCGWKGERISKIAERDEQTCDQPTGQVGVDDGSIGGAEHVVTCCETLVREEISGHARMTTQWARWTGRAD